MSYFKAKMHQIQFRLGLHPRPCWGAYSSPRPVAGLRGPTSKGRGEGEGREGEGRQEKREGRKGEKGSKEGKEERG